jgi:putative Mg2+ transporter-C (MgtC) family protein
MLTFEQMALRLIVALALGALIGLERELVGKYEAGIRTTMLVCGGAAIFSVIAITLPYIVALSPANLADVIARNSGFLGVIANIVVGIGFLGAGIILKTSGHVRGLTTAADVWLAAAIGTLVGIGLFQFAIVSAVLITGLLYLLRKVKLYEHVRPDNITEDDAE